MTPCRAEGDQHDGDRGVADPPAVLSGPAPYNSTWPMEATDLSNELHN